MNTNTLVQKLWNYCNVLRDDGMSYGDYMEQLTFLKTADERAWRHESRQRFGQCVIVGLFSFLLQLK